MSSVNKNAIFASRAEEFDLEKNLIRYFVVPADYELLSKNKAVIIQGGRGSGKTTLLRSLSLEETANLKERTRLVEYWDNNSFIGCYIKMDSMVVPSFNEKGLDTKEWESLFAHYLNLRFTQQVLKTISIINDFDLCELNLTTTFKTISTLIENPKPIDSLNSALQAIKNKTYELLKYINNPDDVKRPIVINNGLLLIETCNSLRENPGLNSKLFFMLVDEYETLYPYQQVVLNTLIRANQPPVIFKIGVRPKGWYTRSTLSPNETLQEQADFDLVNFEDITEKNYMQLIVDIYKKRLEALGISNEEFLDVRNFFPRMPAEEEAANLFSNRKPRYPALINKKLEYLAQTNVIDIGEIDFYYNQLINPSNHLEGRLNLILLERGHHPNEIINEYKALTLKYGTWYHNYKIGALFLLLGEAKVKKQYTGFKTFCLLSSGIIRNFVCFFNRALELHGNFDIQKPSSFTYEIQTKAAYDTSMKAVMELESIPNVGIELQNFVNSLGRIFEALNKDPRQSEPEKNHFTIKSGDLLSNDASKRLDTLLLWSVLHEEDKTKMKARYEERGKDYLINRVYCPYYQISYRKKRKLELSKSQLENLLVGTDNQRRTIAKSLVRGIDEVSKSQESNLYQMELDLEEEE